MKTGGPLRIVFSPGALRRSPPLTGLYRGAPAAVPTRGAAMAKVWFLTGASKGFGQIWAKAALERGDSVAATARDTASLSRPARCSRRAGPPTRARCQRQGRRSTTSVARAIERFGRLDVVVNNAGYGQFGAIEELSEEEARRQIETNLFGPALGHQSRHPAASRPAVGPHPGLLDRRRPCLPDGRSLSRLQVGPRGVQPALSHTSSRTSAST